MKRSTALLLVLLVAGSAACDDSGTPGTGGSGSTSGTTTDVTASATAGSTTSAASSSTTSSSTSASGGTGGGLPECKGYPVSLTLPDTSAAAQAELAAFAPQATLQWNATHGTMSLLTGLDVPLDCSADLWTGAWQVLNAHPALFQLSEPEWDVPAPIPCSAIGSQQIVNTYRATLAGVGIQKDVLALVVAPGPNGGVTLKGVSGFYLPVLEPGDLTACPNVPDATMEPILRAGPYGYSTFSLCTPTGGGVYTPKPNDILTFGDETWEWDDAASGITARKRRTATLVVDESNWTPELMASDMNCPDESGENRILGFVLTFDPVTGELLGVKPGVGCIVC